MPNTTTPPYFRFNLLVKPLQRMTFGGLLTASAFIISGILELQMMKTYAKVPMAGEAHLHVMNSLPCHVAMQLTNGSGLIAETVIKVDKDLGLPDVDR